LLPEKVTRILEKNNITALEFEPGSTPTAETAAKRLGVAVGQIAKSILFIGKDDKKYMVVCPGDRKVSSSKFKACTGTKGKLATAEETLQATGFLPGGVCPFGVEDVEILIDEHLSEYPLFYPAAGTDASAVPLQFNQLLQITGGRVCDLTVPK